MIIELGKASVETKAALPPFGPVDPVTQGSKIKGQSGQFL